MRTEKEVRKKWGGNTASLTFYGGINEVGGNKILLEDGDRIFLDFGKNFEKERQYFDEPYLSPREEKHLLTLGILPQIEGLYKKGRGEPNVDAILLSHPHIDHMDYIRYIKDSIPIYCGITTKTIIIAREFSSKPPSIDYAIANLTKSKGEQVFKSFGTFQNGETKPVGTVEVELVEVDHSVPGAYGFIIRSSRSTIVYTGDFRFHGPKGVMTEEFVAKAKEAKPDALIIEGTNAAETRIATEAEVLAKASQVVSQVPKLVMVSFSTVDIDRLRTFYEIARKSGRRFAVSTRQAFLIDALKVFDLNDPNVAIFVREKKTLREYEQRMVKKYPENVVISTDLSRVQDQTLLVASFYDMNELGEIKPEPGSVYILSQSEPFNEEMEIDYAKLLNWLEFWGIPLYHIHASGHASSYELKRTIAEISPKKVFLVHTERPQLFKRSIQDLDVEVICPEIGMAYNIE